MSGCDLSIIIPVYNDQDNLNRILGELSQNQPDETWEVIVVDDGSPEPLSITNPTGSWHLLRQDKQGGAALARNIGVRKAVGRHIILLSVFLKLPIDYISRIKTFIQTHEFDFAQHLLEKAPEVSANHFQDFLANQGDRVSQKAENLAIKQSLFTAAIISKEAFCRMKGFDESMQHYGGHEMDLIYRLDQADYQKRITISDFSLQRTKLEKHSIIRQRLQEYGHTGLPNLLQKHPELKPSILMAQGLWRVVAFFGITCFLEDRISGKIEADKKLSRDVYRLYLHLIVRNAWDAR